jgi:hypothetical protein
MRRIATKTTDFQTIEVWGNAREVEFRVAGATHAWWHRERFLTGLAWDNLCAACLLRPAGPPKSLLMLGLGGGTTLRSLKHLMPQLQCVAVELDGGMIDLAREYMGLGELGVRVERGDAYAFMETNRQKFDIVLDDVYGSGPEDVARPTLYTAAHTAALRRSLAPGGLFVANLVTGAGHRRMQGSFRKFFTEQFPVVRSISTPDSLNETLVGGEDVLSPGFLAPYQHLWPNGQDRAYWRALRHRRLRPGKTGLA